MAPLPISAKTLIIGSFATDSLTDTTVEAVYISDPITENRINYETEIGVDGRFILALPLTEPRIVYLRYEKHILPLYLQPNDRVQLTAHPNKFYETLVLTGANQVANDYLKAYSQTFPYHQYIDFAILSPEERLRAVLDYHRNTKSILKDLTEQKDKVVPWYKEQAQQVQLPSLVNLHTTKRLDYLYWNQFLYTTDLSIKQLKEQLVNEREAFDITAYRSFLTHYFNRLYHQQHPSDTLLFTQISFKQQHQFIAQQDLPYFVKEYQLAKVFDMALEKNENTIVIEKEYQTYKNNYPNSPYISPLQSKYIAIRKISANALAPDFTLLDDKGESITLSDYSGKFVYITFWASWCRTCLVAASDLAQHKKVLPKDNIVYLYISVDKEEERWRNMLEQQNIKGIHLRTNGMSDPAIIDYNVKKLSKYVLVFPDGTILSKPPQPTDEDFVARMQELLDVRH